MNRKLKAKVMREVTVEEYLGDCVRAYGGEVRKVAWVGRRGAPDRRVMLPFVRAWAELKRPGEKLARHQVREHKRMRALGEIVVTLDSKTAVDEWLIYEFNKPISLIHYDETRK